MTQWTDTRFTVTRKGNLDLTTITRPHVTVRQGDTVITKTNVVIYDAAKFGFFLSQTETGRFRVGDATVQLNYYKDGHRRASKIGRIPVEENTLRRVIE